MSLEKVKKWTEESWFFKWFLNSKTVVGLTILLLLLVIIQVFSKISHLFQPVSQFFEIVGFPMVFAGVLYYLLAPIVTFLTNKKVPKLLAIFVIFLLLLLLLVWGMLVLIPIVQEQVKSMVENLPNYIHTLEINSQKFMKNSFFDPIRAPFQEIEKTAGKELLNYVKSHGATAVPVIGNFFKLITMIVIGIITVPFFLFYLLKDGERLLPSITNLLPERWQKKTTEIFTEMNDQLSSYIRGQLIVAFAVAVMFMIGLKIVGLKYAIVLAISAGILNLIPYLGSFLAMVPIVLLAMVMSPIMVIKVLLVFAIEQTIEGRLISPLVLGNQLNMHPVTIIVVLLTSGSLAGIPGVILGIPFFAIVKVIVKHIYQWHREASSWYKT